MQQLNQDQPVSGLKVVYFLNKEIILPSYMITHLPKNPGKFVCLHKRLCAQRGNQIHNIMKYSQLKHREGNINKQRTDHRKILRKRNFSKYKCSSCGGM